MSNISTDLAIFVSSLLTFDDRIGHILHNITDISARLLFAYTSTLPPRNATRWERWGFEFKRRAVVYYQMQFSAPSSSLPDVTGSGSSSSNFLTTLLFAPTRFRTTFNLHYSLYRHYIAPTPTPEERVYALHTSLSTTISQTTSTLHFLTHLSTTSHNLASRLRTLYNSYLLLTHPSSASPQLDENTWWLQELDLAIRVLSAHERPQLGKVVRVIEGRILERLRSAEVEILRGWGERRLGVGKAGEALLGLGQLEGVLRIGGGKGEVGWEGAWRRKGRDEVGGDG